MAESSDVAIELPIGAVGDPTPEPVAAPGQVTAIPDSPLFGRTLRIALAMRGGVSLAVWIGGVVAELDVVRRIRWVTDPDDGSARAWFIQVGDRDRSQERRAAIYARLLRAAGYDRVELDVLAGASAGGLNAVMYGAAQRAGASLDQLITTWGGTGAVWGLLNGPGIRGLDAPLRGDDYFYPAVRSSLDAFYSADSVPRNALHRADQLVVDLSTTVIDTGDAPDDEIRSGRGHFHFVGGAPGRPDTPGKEHGRGIPPADRAPADRVDDLSRMAYSARATSSLPGVFEPALISSVVTDPTGATGLEPDRIDFSFAFHAHRTALDQPFRAADGGLLDNIPIDRAFRAVRAMASEVHADRALIYLDPDPKHPSPPTVADRYDGAYPSTRLVQRRRTDAASRIFRILPRGLSHFIWHESGADEEDAVGDFRRELALADSRNAGFTALEGDYDAERSGSAYALSRTRVDGDLLRRVFEAPAIWQLGSELPTRSSRVAWTDDQLTALETSFAVPPAQAETFRDAGWVASGSVAMADAAKCLLDWVRALELDRFAKGIPTTQVSKRGSTLGGLGLAELRLRVYTALQTATRDRDLRVDAALALGAAADAPTVRDFWFGVSGTDAPTAPAESQLWDELDALLTALRASDVTLGDSWTYSPWSRFPATARARDLAPFVCGRGVPEPVHSVGFWKITADEPPASADQYAALVSTERGRRIRTILTGSRRDPIADARDLTEIGLDGRAKLPSASLGAFAGFLSADWRRNDWWWGRLDGAAGMTRYLAQLPPHPGLAPDEAIGDVDLLREAVQAAVLEHASTDPESPFATDLSTATTRVRRAELLGGSQGVADLNPGYRTAALGRGLRVGLRSISRGPKTLVTWLIAGILRPFLAILALVVDKARFAVIGALLLAAFAVGAGWGRIPVGPAPSPALVIPFVGLASIAALAGAGTIAVGAGRWSYLQSLPLDPGILGHLRRERRIAVGGAIAGYLTAVAILAITWTLWAVGILGPTPTVMAALLALAVSSASVGRARKPQGTRASFMHWLLWTIVAALVAVGGLVTSVLVGRAELGSLPLVLGSLVGAVGLIAWLVVSAGWLWGVRPARREPGTPPSTERTPPPGFVAVLLGCVLATGSGFLVAWAIACGLARTGSGLGIMFSLTIGLLVAGTVIWWVPELGSRYVPSDRPVT